MADQGPLRIKRLKLENFKRIKLVDITPDGDVVTLAGDNGQGKSSVLDGIEWLFRGKKAQPEEPIRKGQKQARAVGELSDAEGKAVLKVERITKAGSESVRVRWANETRDAQRPQSLLDTFYGMIALRPLRLAGMSSKQLGEELRKLTGCDTADLDRDYAKLYAERTEKGRHKDIATKRLQSTVEPDAKPKLPHPEVPAEPIAIGALVLEQEILRSQRAQNDEQRNQTALTRIALVRAADEMAAAQERVTQANLDLSIARDKHSRLTEEVTLLAERDTQLVDPDEMAVRAEIAGADDVNRKVAENNMAHSQWEHARTEYAELERAADELRGEYEAMTEQLRLLEHEKGARVASHKMPIDGLSFAADGSATYRDLPLEQASEAERYRVFTAIAAAQNPRLRVLLLENAALLDSKSRRLFAELAQQYGAQCWEEQIDTTIPGAIVLEDGEVVEEQHEHRHPDAMPSPAPGA
jgi:hypothetical protein